MYSIKNCTMLAVLSVLLVAVATIRGCEVRRSKEAYLCCAPKQYEAQVFLMGASILKGTFLETNRISYDWTNNRIAYILQHITLTSIAARTVIGDYRKGLHYTIEGADGEFTKCTIKNFTSPFPPTCIPKDAKNVYQTYMGSGGDRLNITSYYYEASLLPGNFSVVSSVTPNCTPVIEMLLGQMQGSMGFVEGAYTEFTKGIQDESVFDPPEICNRPSTTPHRRLPKRARKINQFLTTKFFGSLE